MYRVISPAVTCICFNNVHFTLNGIDFTAMSSIPILIQWKFAPSFLIVCQKIFLLGLNDWKNIYQSFL